MSSKTRRLLPIPLVVYFAMIVATSHGALCAAALSFDFDFSDPSTFSLTDFTTSGNATFPGKLFDLTANANSAGRVTYALPVPLHDDATGLVASFTTAFSFAINITDANNKGDGMAFFLGHYPPALPANSQGGALGLCTDFCDATKTAGDYRFVAVEFDTFANSWDPNVTQDHMGIDVSSIASVANISLPSFSLNGTMSAVVDYNGSTGVMNVELRLDHSPLFGDATPVFNFSARVDLSAELPEQVAIGFSAATGASIELHQLLSWSFSLVAPWSSSGSPASSDSRIGLKVALGITSSASVFLCIAVVALLRALRRKHLPLAEIQLESEANVNNYV